MINNIKRLMIDESGATLVEYGLIVALIAAVCVFAVQKLGNTVNGAINQTQQGIAGTGG